VFVCLALQVFLLVLVEKTNVYFLGWDLVREGRYFVSRKVGPLLWLLGEVKGEKPHGVYAEGSPAMRFLLAACGWGCTSCGEAWLPAEGPGCHAKEARKHIDKFVYLWRVQGVMHEKFFSVIDSFVCM
jgi:hypothetical protein